MDATNQIQDAPQKSNLPYPDKIDYEKHPAYAALITSATTSDKIKSIGIFIFFASRVLIKRIVSYEQIQVNKYLKPCKQMEFVWSKQTQAHLQQ